MRNSTSGEKTLMSFMYNRGRQEEANVNMIDFGDVVRNVYRGVVPMKKQEVKNIANMLNKDRLLNMLIGRDR